jgi:hypothetical protein
VIAEDARHAPVIMPASKMGSPGRGFGMPAGQVRGLTYQIAAASIWTGCGDLG